MRAGPSSRPSREADLNADAGPSFGTILRAARTEAGLSERELARRSGVSQASISGIEAGRDPSMTTVSRLLRALPRIDLRECMGLPRSPARPASAAAWRHVQRITGLQSRRMTLEAVVLDDGSLQPSLAVEGLRMRGGLADPLRRAAAMGVAYTGTPNLAWQLVPKDDDLRRGRREIVDGDVLHVFELPRDLDRRGLSYRRTSRRPVAADDGMADGSARGRPFERGLSAWLDHPTRELVVSVRFPRSVRPLLRVHAWPASLAVDPAHPVNRWTDLYPGTPAELVPDSDGVAQVVVRLPPPLLRWGLSWEPRGEVVASSRIVAGPATRAPRPGRAIAAARRASGLSQRELARRAATSPATVIAAESGRPLRLSTAIRCLRSLPSLSPWLLVGEGLGPALTHEDAWGIQRDLFGVEVEQETRAFELRADGSQSAVLTTTGLTWAPESEADLRLRLGLLRMPDSGRRELLAVLPDGRSSKGPRIRVVRGGGAPITELRFTPGRGRPRVSYVRRARVGPGEFAMTLERAHDPAFIEGRWRALRPDGSLAEAIYVEPALPARRLVVRIAFPKGLEPRAPVAKVLPRAIFAVESIPDLRPRVHAGGFELGSARRGRELVLSVDLPLVGLRYGLSWEIR